jgi:hypothetical protein
MRTVSWTMKMARRIICTCVLIVLAATTACADICLLKVASASHVRGQVKYEQDPLERIPVQLWKSDKRGTKVSLVAEDETYSSGYFTFSSIPIGWYRLVFPVPGFDGDDFLIHLQGTSVLRMFPGNWLQVGLGIPSIHCPQTSLKATRSTVKREENR